MIDSNVIEKTEEQDIEVWQVLAGEITELKIQGSIFVVKPNTKVNPIKAAKDFLAAFDTKKTAIRQKLLNKPEAPAKEVKTFTNKQQKAVATRQKHSDMEVVGKFNNIPVYKEYVMGFYRKYPNTFTGKDVVEYLGTVYDHSSVTTLTNKQRAYIKFMRENGYIEQIAGAGKTGRVYKFIEIPYGAVPPAQAEFDPEYMQSMKNMQLLTIRDQ